MATRDDELEAFKTRINLSEYAAAHGYELDVRASSRSSAVMRHATGDKIIIAMDDAHWVYFSVRDPADHGSIIDFIQHRQRVHLGQVRQMLRPWLEGQDRRTVIPARPAARSFVAKLDETKKDLVAVRTRVEAMKPVTGHHPYLVEQRRIPAPLLASERFSGHVHVDARGNAIFVHHNRDGICGYEIKNAGFTGFAPGGEKGLWFSQRRPDDNRLVIAETTIDALSYAVIRGHERAQFASIAGQMNPQQPALLRAVMEKMPAGSRIIAATDQDYAGEVIATLIREILEAVGRKDLVFCEDRPALANADWNDVLRGDVSELPRPAP